MLHRHLLVAPTTPLQHFKRLSKSVLLGASLILSSPLLLANTVDFSQVVEQVSPSVVRVNVSLKASKQELANQQQLELLEKFFGYQIPERQRQTPEAEGFGTGFFISNDGYLLTNHHVIQNASSITITLSDRRELDATVVGSDERTDVALLKVSGNNFPALPLGDSEDLKVGAPVLAIGSPFGYDLSVTSGIVSAKSRNMRNESNVPFIQTDVALNPGNSGGPLFDQSGKVVGINSRIFSGTGGYMGLSFSIPIDFAMDIVDQLKGTGKVERAYLGVFPQDIDRNLAEVYGLSKPEGALITRVSPDSAASAAGIKEGDIIVNFNNKKVTQAADLINAINRLKPGTNVNVTVLRDGKPKTIQATLRKATDNAEGETAPANGQASIDSKTLDIGLQIRELSAQEKAKTKEMGVLVTRVEARSSAAKAGITTGDLITRLAGKPINDIASFNKAMQTLKVGSVVEVRVLRQGTMPIILGMRVRDNK